MSLHVNRPARRIDTMRRSRDRDGNYAVSRKDLFGKEFNFENGNFVEILIVLKEERRGRVQQFQLSA